MTESTATNATPSTSPPSPLRRFIAPTWAQRKKTLHIQAWLLITLSYIALPITWLTVIPATETHPAWIAFAWFNFMCRTFTYHLGLLLLTVGLIAALAKQKRLATLALPLILFTIAPTWRHYLPKTITPPTTATTPNKNMNPSDKGFNSGVFNSGVSLKVLSMNLLYINKNTDPLINQIKQHNPDLILFQEYAGHWQQAMAKSLYTLYPYRIERPLNHSFGAAIFSKTPFTDPPTTLDYSTPDTPQLRTAIQHQGRTIAVYNIHLLPPTSLVNTIHQRRAHARLVTILQNETRPTILAGDFNFTTDTRMAATIRALNFRDAQYTAGTNPGSTWPAHSIFPYLPFPKIRIDHLYLSQQLTAYSAATAQPQGSDHRPIISTLGFRAPTR